MGLCTGCRKRGDASRKERCTCFKSELSTIIAVLSSFAAVDGGAAAPAAAAESVRCVALVGSPGAAAGVGNAPIAAGAPHGIPHGGAASALANAAVAVGTALVVEALLLPAWRVASLVTFKLLHWHEGWLQNHGCTWETPSFFVQIHIAHSPAS